MSLPPEITFIERGWYNANHVVIQNKDGPILIDSGHLLCVDETLDLLRQNSIAPESIRQIVNTHSHSDHIGGNGTIQRLSGCTIACSPLTAKWLQTHDRRNMWLEHYGQVTEIVEPNIIIEPGSVITLGDLDFEVVSLPGHGPDTIGFYQPDNKVMICADALWHGDFGVLNIMVHGSQIIDDALAAIERLGNLDIRLAIPGHGGLIHDVPANLDVAARRLDSFQKDSTKLAWHLVRRILMFTILRYQPVDCIKFVEIVTHFPWIHDYAPLCGEMPDGGQWSAERLINYVIDGFVERGTVVRVDNQITSCVAK